MAVPAEHGAIELRVGANPAVRLDDRVVDLGVLLDMAVPADDRVGPDARAALDRGVLIDETGAFNMRAILDLRIGRDPGQRLRARERRSLVAPVHDVAVHLAVLLARADVNPV